MNIKMCEIVASNMQSIQYNIVTSLIVGVLSGLVASVIYMIIMNTIKPKIKIAEDLAVEVLPENKFIIRVKIVNKTRQALANINYSLSYYIQTNPDNWKVCVLEPRQTQPIPIVGKYRKKATDNEIRISYMFDLNKIEDPNRTINDYGFNEKSEMVIPVANKFVFNIVASHPFTNATACSIEEYKMQHLIKGTYIEGDDMGVERK